MIEKEPLGKETEEENTGDRGDENRASAVKKGGDGFFWEKDRTLTE